MFDFKKGNILKDCSEAIINTVNCVGVMGRGIALQFKQTYPDNYKAYKSACDKGEVKLGKMFIYSLESLFNPKYIINFPTKNHWKEKSSLESIELGLLDLKKTIIEYKIKSIAIPPLGCGLGGLNWKEVKSLITKTFDDLKTVDFIIYEPSEQTVTIKSEVIPELTSSRAALIELINRYLQSMLDPFITLLEIHKLMYFLQESGQPLKLNYSKAIYGPYAENLRHVLFRLSGHYIGGYDGEDSPSKNITLSPNAIDKANQLVKSDCELLSKLDKVSNLVNGFETPYGLELLSTVHWVVCKEYKSTINEVVDAVYAWNPQKKKFSQRQIEIAFNTLKSQNWLSNIDTH